MRPLHTIVSLAVAGLLVTAVPAVGQSQPPDGSPPEFSPQGITWQLTNARLSGAYAEIPDSVIATLRLDDGLASGTGSCNGFSASYVLDGASLTFGPVVSTMMLCVDPNGGMSIETFYFADLESVASYTTDGLTLTLKDAAGEPVLAFAVATVQITGIDWQLIQVAVEGALSEVPPGVTATIRFENGEISGRAGCNTFSGSYTIDGSSLTFGLITTTEMGCPDDARMGVEGAYYAALPLVASFLLDRGSLSLLGADGNPVLVYSAIPETVVGSWIVTGIGDGQGAISNLIADSVLTADFADDGSVSGSSGCNDFHGTYTTSGNTIVIDALITTKRACVNGGVGDQEVAYLEALRSATTFEVSEGTLQLLGADGSTLVTFASGLVLTVGLVD